MRFVVDAQLPPAMVNFLEARGHVAEHVSMRFPPGTTDETIWQYAASNEAIIVSKDEDFSVFISMRHTGPSLLWLRMGNTSNRALLTALATIWDDIENALKRGDRLIEVG
jgi:predicted nuclease of predicted toxin-antitoxin system